MWGGGGKMKINGNSKLKKKFHAKIQFIPKPPTLTLTHTHTSRIQTRRNLNKKSFYFFSKTCKKVVLIFLQINHFNIIE